MQIEQRIIATIEPWYGKRCGPDSVFNDNEALSGDDAEQMLLDICNEFSLDPVRFFDEIPFNTLFHAEWSAAFLPLVPFFRWRNRKRPPAKLRQFTVTEFSEILSSRFGLDAA
jgi:hypothetical protein